MFVILEFKKIKISEILIKKIIAYKLPVDFLIIGQAPFSLDLLEK